MSVNTMITDKKNQPNPQKVKWKNVAYYNTFLEADNHRNTLSGLVKVRRCGPEGSKFVVKIGTLIKESSNE